jgi:hypothetical protein
MSESNAISRRGALSLLGLAAAFGLGVPPTVLTVSEAEAQATQTGEKTEEKKTGTERRQARRTHRVERRTKRRKARHKGRTERRELRRKSNEEGQKY